MTRASPLGDQPPGWSDHDLDPWPEVAAGDRGLLSSARDDLDAAGFAVVRMAAATAAQAPATARRASTLVGELGRPLRIFAGRPFWRALLSDPDRPRSSSGGLGEQLAHMDFVNAARPPELVCLYCYRSDPAGGGASVIAPVDVLEDLPSRDRELLSRARFSDGVVSGLAHVGEDINPFAVWSPEAHYRVRWTGKLAEAQTDPESRAALERAAALLRRSEQEVALAPGELLLIDQRRVVHGRRALADDSERTPAHERRLLMHAFARR